MGDLLKLAERCEAATGPDRELDAAIEKALPPSVTWARGDHPAHVNTLWNERAARYHAAGIGDWDDQSDYIPTRYTASLDAAMTLVPDKWMINFIQEIEYLTAHPRPWTVELRFREEFIAPKTIGPTAQQTWSATPALALAAAALRARDSDRHPNGPRLPAGSGSEATRARAEGIAQDQPS